MTTGKGGGGPGGCSCGFNPAREFNTVDPARRGDSEPQFVFIAGQLNLLLLLLLLLLVIMMLMVMMMVMMMIMMMMMTAKIF